MLHFCICANILVNTMYHTFLYLEHTWNYDHICTSILKSILGSKSAAKNPGYRVIVNTAKTKEPFWLKKATYAFFWWKFSSFLYWIEITLENWKLLEKFNWHYENDIISKFISMKEILDTELSVKLSNPG